DLLFVPVIGVPAALAWTAMASYGAHLYGPPGRALPAFSEGAMWAFAAATTITRHRHPDRPVWHLRLGTLVFALFGAVLNFAHGFTLGGVVTGVVMALISVAGVTAHQITKGGPRPARRTRKTRAERDAARIARQSAKRVRQAREEAVKAAKIELTPDGDARLVFIPTGEPDPLTPTEAEAIRGEVADMLGDALATVNAALTGTTENLRSAIDGMRDTLRAEIAAARQKPAGKADQPARPDLGAAARNFHAHRPDMSAADIATALGISERTVRRHLAAGQESTPEAA
ncbi:MAG TPA: HTH domain-containing protein, partial [Trebonia sp.]|nr:HTH domain-containing protein [Trebonia sp.]